MNWSVRRCLKTQGKLIISTEQGFNLTSLKPFVYSNCFTLVAQLGFPLLQYFTRSLYKERIIILLLLKSLHQDFILAVCLEIYKGYLHTSP